MPSLWDDDETAMDGHTSVNNRNRNTNLSAAATSGGTRFSTRDFSIDQSLNLMFGGGGSGAGGESPVTNLSRADPQTSGAGDGFASSVVSLFRASGSNDAPPVFDEYGDAAPSTESEEYISDKRRRTAPLMALLRGFIGTKYFNASVLGCILFGVLFWTLTGPSRSERRMKRYIVDKGITSAEAFKQSGSPQSLALDWVANQDPAQLKPDDPGAVDRYILAVFYYGSRMQQQQGDWTSSNNWLTGKGVCAWEGVQCFPKEVDPNEPPIQNYDANGSIIGLVLPSNGMEGTIPDEFARFPELVTLDLSDNGISGTIPAALGTMKNIRNLILRQNSIAGTFPSELTALTQLYQLHLGENMMTGYIPDDIGLLSVLRTLSVSSNNFEGFFPYLEPCTKLVRIHVDNNKFSATLPAWLGKMSDLSEYRVYEFLGRGRTPMAIAWAIQTSLNALT